MLFLLLGAGYLIDPMLAHYLRRFAGNYLNSVGMRCETVGLAMSEKRTSFSCCLYLTALRDHIFSHRQQESSNRGGVSDLAVTY